MEARAPWVARCKCTKHGRKWEQEQERLFNVRIYISTCCQTRNMEYWNLEGGVARVKSDGISVSEER